MGKLEVYVTLFTTKYPYLELLTKRVLICIHNRLSCVVHEDKAYSEARWLVGKLKEVIPRQMFKVAIQAVIGSKVVASEHINAFRKGMFLQTDRTLL